MTNHWHHQSVAGRVVGESCCADATGETGPQSGHRCESSAGGCAHHDHGSADSRRLTLALVIIGAFAVAEIIGGWLSNSLALMADAGHMVTDAVAIMLALWARHLSTAPATATLPYGRSRAQVLAAFVNGIALFVLIAALLRESIGRIAAPEAINTGLMLLVASIGLAANIAAFAVLHAGDRKDINMRGALLHVVGDMLGSVAAIVSAIVIGATGWKVVDPLVTVIVCGLIARSAYFLTRDAAHVLLQGAPRDINTERLKENLLNKVPGFEDIHELKVWMLTPNDIQLTMHARLRAGGDANAALRLAKAELVALHGIENSIIQIEAAPTKSAKTGASARCPDHPLEKPALDAPRHVSSLH